MSTINSGELSESFGVNVTPEQKRKLRVQAAQQDMTISEYVREVLFEDGPVG